MMQFTNEERKISLLSAGIEDNLSFKTYHITCPDLLRAGRFGNRIPVGTRPVQTGWGAHPTPCLLDARSLSRGQRDRGVAWTIHPI
jgi:hypothetical protein